MVLLVEWGWVSPKYQGRSRLDDDDGAVRHDDDDSVGSHGACGLCVLVLFVYKSQLAPRLNMPVIQLG